MLLLKSVHSMLVTTFVKALMLSLYDYYTVDDQIFAMHIWTLIRL
jgi:hypothetical protein